MTKIAETYLRLDINVDEKDRIELRRYLERQVRYYAKDLFHQEIDFLVRVEEGSIKIWVLIGGIIFTSAVKDYGAFRTGIDYIIKDARSFSEIVMKDAKQSGITEREIARFERRLGVPGKIKRVFKKLEKLHTQGRDLSKDAYDKKITLIQKNLVGVFRQIDNQSDAKLIMDNIPSKIRSSLPALPQLPKNVAMPKIALRPEEWDIYPDSIALPSITQSIQIGKQTLVKDNFYEIRTTNSGIKFLAKGNN